MKEKTYEVLCISMYHEDVERAEALVAELRARGFHKANRSALIRYAITLVDPDHVPKGML